MNLLVSCLNKILDYEGGFTSHPKDKGGPTSLGITLGTLQRAFADFDYGDFDRDGDVDTHDVQLLKTLQQSVPIYKRYFWDVIHGDEFHSLPKVAFVLLDTAINHGPKNAVLILQRTLNRFHYDLKVDGIIGSKTIAAAKAVGDTLLGEFFKERRMFYDKIISTHPDQNVFYRGWMNRMEKLEKDAETFQGGSDENPS